MKTSQSSLHEIVRSSPFEVISGAVYFSAHISSVKADKAFAILRDDVEVTFIAGEDLISSDDKSARGPFRLIRLRVSSPFEAPGFIAYASKLVAEAECSVLVISSYSFDYLIVKEGDLHLATNALLKGGFTQLIAP